MKHKGVRLPANLLAPVETCKSVLICLPYQGLKSLLALSERMEWETTWVNEAGQRQPLTDAQVALIDATIGGLNCPMCMDDLLAALGGIQTAIENQELSVDVAALVAAVGGVQTAIENQELSVTINFDIATLVAAVNGVQTAIENQELSLGDVNIALDLTSLEAILTGIQTAIENQELSVDLADFQAAIVAAVAGVQTAIENIEPGAGGDVDLTGLEAVLTGIQTAIENLSEEEMNIVNNLCCCGGGCGCGKGGDGGIDQKPPDDYIPPIDTPTPYDPELPTPEYQQFSCNMAHYLYYQYRTGVLQTAEIVAIGEASYGAVAQILGATLFRIDELFGTEYLLLWETYYLLVTTYINNLSGSSSAAMVQEMDRHYNEFVCALYSGDGPDDKQAQFNSVIDSLALSSMERYWLKLMAQEFPTHYFYMDNWQDFEFPAGYTDRDCSGCMPMAGNPLENLGCQGGYELVDITETTSVVWDDQDRPGEVGQVTHSGNLIELSGVTSDADYGNADHIIDFTFTCAPFPPPTPNGTPLVFFMHHQGTQRIQYEATATNAPRLLVVGGTTAVNNAILATFGLDIQITHSGGQDGIFQLYLGTAVANVPVKTTLKLYAVVGCVPE